MSKRNKPETKICKHCRTEIPFEAKVCPQCRKKQKGGPLKFIVAIIVIAVIIIGILISGSNTELSDDAKNMSAKDFKAACQSFEYKELARNAADMKGTKIKLKAKVQQVVYESENGTSEYLIEVTKDEYDFWDDGVYFRYELKDGERIIEDDIITVYGEITGEKSYTTVLGASITVPEVTGVYIKIK